ncbi:hypothetical protein B2J93_5857 [Marssonina coronariae]|uniref:Uncharacterized protein n=1 Tax=Diplocarpon coronariae TaxID=2795749 RepID=A0A218Z7D0_9HELO|nr:hypothetical protein JHW43_009054 [Diplocarpon mali]OWP03898.1 hypothetical protein B2J93_5857 [Marssonina coronariae]
MSLRDNNKSPNSVVKDASSESFGLRGYETKPTFGQKFKRHCARFWWAHVILICLVSMVITLIVVYVAYPKMAQHDVNKATLEFRDGSFTNPTSDSIRITQNATLHNPSTFRPTLDAFPAELYLVTNGTYGSAPMLTLPMPHIHARKYTNTSVDSVAQITNLDQVSAYAVTVMTSEYVETALIQGLVTPTPMSGQRLTHILALNSLKGFNTTDLLINATATAGTPNLRGNAQIPNPSLMTIVLGNVTLDLSTEAKGVVGNATIENFILRPGANTMPMSAIIDQPKVLASLNKAGKVNMTITGKSAVYDGQHLSYYEKALASNVLVLEMNVQQILADSIAAARKAANATST